MKLYNYIVEKILLPLLFDNERAEYPSTFQKELNYQSSRIIPIGSVIMAVAWISYIPIDKQLHPEEPLIQVLRLGLSFFGILFLILHFTKKFIHRSLLFLTISGCYLVIATGIITALTKGDSVYIGGYLFIITLLAVVPIRRKAALGILFSSLSAFFTIGLMKGMSFSSVSGKYSLNDLISTTVVSVIFILLLDHMRFRSWKKSKKIEENQAVIVKQKNLIDEHLNWAGEIQKNLLPRNIPMLQEAVIAFRYYPMMQVGGDFVDICHSTVKNMLGLFVCDVSGHGVASAMISSMIKMSLYLWDDFIENPKNMLHSINASMSGKLGENFLSACICSLDMSNGRLLISNAGHPPVIIVRSGGIIDVVRIKGRIISNFTNPNYEQLELLLKNGDKLILYTDGIIEAFNQNKDLFGEDRFIDMIKKYSSMKPENMCEKFTEELYEYINGKVFTDDVALIIIEYLGKDILQLPSNNQINH